MEAPSRTVRVVVFLRAAVPNARKSDALVAPLELKLPVPNSIELSKIISNLCAALRVTDLCDPLDYRLRWSRADEDDNNNLNNKLPSTMGLDRQSRIIENKWRRPSSERRKGDKQRKALIVDNAETKETFFEIYYLNDCLAGTDGAIELNDVLHDGSELELLLAPALRATNAYEKLRAKAAEEKVVSDTLFGLRSDMKDVHFVAEFIKLGGMALLFDLLEEPKGQYRVDILVSIEKSLWSADGMNALLSHPLWIKQIRKLMNSSIVTVCRQALAALSVFAGGAGNRWELIHQTLCMADEEKGDKPYESFVPLIICNDLDTSINALNVLVSLAENAAKEDATKRLLALWRDSGVDDAIKALNASSTNSVIEALISRYQEYRLQGASPSADLQQSPARKISLPTQALTMKKSVNKGGSFALLGAPRRASLSTVTGAAITRSSKGTGEGENDVSEGGEENGESNLEDDGTQDQVEQLKVRVQGLAITVERLKELGRLLAEKKDLEILQLRQELAAAQTGGAKQPTSATSSPLTTRKQSVDADGQAELGEARREIRRLRAELERQTKEAKGSNLYNDIQDTKVQLEQLHAIKQQVISELRELKQLRVGDSNNSPAMSRDHDNSSGSRISRRGAAINNSSASSGGGASGVDYLEFQHIKQDLEKEKKQKEELRVQLNDANAEIAKLRISDADKLLEKNRELEETKLKLTKENTALKVRLLEASSATSQAPQIPADSSAQVRELVRVQQELDESKKAHERALEQIKKITGVLRNLKDRYEAEVASGEESRRQVEALTAQLALQNAAKEGELGALVAALKAASSAGTL